MAILQIPISKGGKGAFFAVDTNDLDEAFDSNPDLMTQVITEGLKTILNSRMSKATEFPAPTKLEGADLEEAKSKALAKAAENYDDFKAGKLSKKSKAATTEKKEVLTEALRLAKEVVKDKLKANKVRISTVAAKDITAAAKALLEADRDTFVEKAKANLSERSATPSAIDILALVKPDPKLVAKAEREKAEKKQERSLSAKQAGIPKARGKVAPRRGDQPTAH